MKSELPIWFLLLTALSALSQSNDPVRLRANFIDRSKPFRMANDVLYDFTPIVVEMSKGGVVQVGNRAFWGTVKQVLDDGLLVRALGTLIHVRHHHEQEGAIDGSRIHIVAIGCGRYRYSNTAGSTSAIPDFDCGLPLFLPCIFTNKTMVYSGDTVDVPISELDIKAFAFITARTNNTATNSVR